MTNREAIKMLEYMIVDDDTVEIFSQLDAKATIESNELAKKSLEAVKKMNKYRWHDLKKNPNNLPKPNTWVMVCQSFSDPKYTVGMFYMNKIGEDRFHKYWTWFDNHTIGKAMICPGNEYVLAWKEIEGFGDRNEKR